MQNKFGHKYIFWNKGLELRINQIINGFYIYFNYSFLCEGNYIFGIGSENERVSRKQNYNQNWKSMKVFG